MKLFNKVINNISGKSGHSRSSSHKSKTSETRSEYTVETQSTEERSTAEVASTDDDNNNSFAEDVTPDYEYSCHNEDETESPDAADESTSADYAYGDQPNYGYGEQTDYGYGETNTFSSETAKTETIDYGYGDQPDYGYGDQTGYGYGDGSADSAPTTDYGYGDAAPDEALQPRQQPRRRNSCVVRREADNPLSVAEYLMGVPPMMSDKDMRAAAAEGVF